MCFLWICPVCLQAMLSLFILMWSWEPSLFLSSAIHRFSKIPTSMVNDLASLEIMDIEDILITDLVPKRTRSSS